MNEHITTTNEITQKLLFFELPAKNRNIKKTF